MSALLGPDVATDVQTLGLIQGPALAPAAAAGARAWGLLPALLRPPQEGRRRSSDADGHAEQKAAAPKLDAGCAAAAAAVAEAFRLNDAQGDVATHVASWLPELRRRAAEGSKGAAARRPVLVKPAAKQLKLEAGASDAAAADAGGDCEEAEADAAAKAAGPPAAPVCLVHGGMGCAAPVRR